MTVHYLNKYLRITLLTIGIWFLCAFNVQEQWRGTLLITKVDGVYHTFIDRIKDVNNLSILTKINDTKNQYSITRKNDVIRIKSKEGESGYIAVMKNRRIVASVKLKQIRLMNPIYFQNRVNKVSEGLDTLANGEPTIYTPKQKAEEDSAVFDHQTIVFLNEHKEFEVIEENNEKRIVEKEKIEEPVALEEVLEEETMKVTSDLSIFEEFLLNNHFELKVDNPEDIYLKKDLPPTILKEAENLEEEYSIIYNYYSWLHLKDKKSEKDLAFDGEYLLEIDSMYFQMQNNNKLGLKSFYINHEILLKPHNKKWMGIYYKDILLSEFKSKNGYKVLEINDNDFILMVHNHKYKVKCEDNIVTIKKDDHIIEKFNTESFNQKPVPLFKD